MVPRNRGNRKGLFGTVLAVITVIAVIAIPVVVIFGGDGEPNSSADGSGVFGQSSRSERAVLDVPEQNGWSPDDAGTDGDFDEFLQNSTGSQVTFVRLTDGFHAGTATERFARPALSLGKLYIADYVMRNGTDTEVYQAVEMIRSSDNEMANELYAEYPESIAETADRYGLLSTRSHERWGYSVTSTYDVVTFIAALMEEDRTHPILVAMAASEDVAADGYEQDFGTAVLPGALGTKWGWSDDRQLHSSVTFGADWVAAAAVTGAAEDLTSLVTYQIEDLPTDESGNPV